MPKKLLTRLINWFGGREPVFLVSLLIIVVGSWGFAELVGDVFEGDTEAFDKHVLELFREPENPSEPRGPEWLEEGARDVTALGGNAVLVLYTVGVGGYLWLSRQHRMMLLLFAATGTGLLLSSLLKASFQRPRPDIHFHAAPVFTTSFPSGHSMMSAVVYLTLGALLASTLSKRRLKIYVLAISLFLTVLVGTTRVFLGVHYPTDVFAGWTAGLVWALLCWIIAHHLQSTGAVEQSGDSSSHSRTAA